METKEEKGLIQQGVEQQKEKVLERIQQENNFEQEPEQLSQIEEETAEGGVLSYKRVDTLSGEINDPDFIEAYKVSQVYDVALNYLLGDYDDEGEYVIATDILNALVKVNKRVTRAYADTLYLETFSDFAEKGKIQFSLSFLRGEGNKQKAVLKLLEPISKVNDYIINTQSFIIATYTDENNDDYLRKVRKVFHIYNPEDEVGKEDPEIVAVILKRIKMIAVFKQELLTNIQEREEKYFLARIDILKDPRLEEILLEFERLKSKAGLFLNPENPLYFLYLNTILDMAIENKMHILELEQNTDLIKAYRVVIREYVAETNLEIQKAQEKTAEILGQAPTPVKPKSKSKGAELPYDARKKIGKVSPSKYNTKSMFGAGKEVKPTINNRPNNGNNSDKSNANDKSTQSVKFDYGREFEGRGQG